MDTPVVMDMNLGPKHLRRDFPNDFMFGAATSSFQIEGAVNEDGRTDSIWDTFCKERELHGWEKASDHYHKYKEDVKAIKEMGLDAYRFSISWSRVLPTGTIRGGVNEEGINFYDNLIKELLDNDIKPIVTLFHWDLPQALETKYYGFLDRHIVDDFREYADLCFTKFGDRVKHWITFNESWSFSYFGYGLGTLAPGRGGSSSAEQIPNINAFVPSSRFLFQHQLVTKKITGTIDFQDSKTKPREDPGREPYIVAHHQLLAHAHVVQLYRNKYQKPHGGKIGITLVSNWMVPNSHSSSDHNAAERALDFMLGWFMDPVINGDYPKSMRCLVKERLPKFTKLESHMLKGSFDFIGLNYYTTNYAAHVPDIVSGKPHIATDKKVKFFTERNGFPIGEQGGSDWLYVYPRGLMELLLYIKTKYNNPSILITENGMDEKYDTTLPLWEALSDHKRVSYHHSHLCFIKRAINEYGINVKGYFTWSLLDNFEWAAGLSVRFGNIYIDYDDEFKRHPKLSANWFKFHLHCPEPLATELQEK